MADAGSMKQAHRTLDCIGLYCPMPILKTREEIDKLAVGEVLEVLADDPAAEPDIKAWAKRTSQKILKIEKTPEGIMFRIQKTK
jgi:tRNA 2-thiouridine synthesizing protein A